MKVVMALSALETLLSRKVGIVRVLSSGKCVKCGLNSVPLAFAYLGLGSPSAKLLCPECMEVECSSLRGSILAFLAGMGLSLEGDLMLDGTTLRYVCVSLKGAPPKCWLCKRLINRAPVGRALLLRRPSYPEKHFHWQCGEVLLKEVLAELAELPRRLEQLRTEVPLCQGKARGRSVRGREVVKYPDLDRLRELSAMLEGEPSS